MTRDTQPTRKPDDATKKQQPQQGGERGSKVQGEGDYEANRRYRDQAEQFAQQSDKVHQAGEDAAPDSAEEAEQMDDAEKKGLSRAKK